MLSPHGLPWIKEEVLDKETWKTKIDAMTV